jgi:hypothetical protein
MTDELQKIAEELWRRMPLPDLASDDELGMDYLPLFVRGKLKIKMYQEPGHALPHVHVDYACCNHAASYSIDPASRLAGNIDRKVEREVLSWIEVHQAALLTVWSQLQSGEPVTLAFGD